jgi:hypothetical protein
MKSVLDKVDYMMNVHGRKIVDDDQFLVATAQRMKGKNIHLFLHMYGMLYNEVVRAEFT